MLRTIREEQGLTRKELGKLSDVKERTIEEWEVNGIEHGTLGNVKKVADALNCLIDDLLPRD